MKVAVRRSLYTVISCRYTPRPSKRPLIARTRGEAPGHRHRLPAFDFERHPVRDSDESCQQHWRTEVSPPRLPSRQTSWSGLRDLQEQSEIQSPSGRRESQKDPSLGFARRIGIQPILRQPRRIGRLIPLGRESHESAAQRLPIFSCAQPAMSATSSWKSLWFVDLI